MASKELIEKVARAIHEADDMDETYLEMKSFFDCLAEAAISTIFAALQEPTEVMKIAGTLGMNGDHFLEISKSTWRAMLNASPLGEQSE